MTQTMRPMIDAPLYSDHPDYGPETVLLVDGRELVGRYCHGLELGEIWIPPGWYVDGEEVEPTAWRPA